MPSVWRKTGDSWVKIKTVYRKTSGSWQSVKRIWRKTGGAWYLVFQQSLTPSIQTKVAITLSTANATTQTKKITGTLYSWNNSTGVTYQFAKGSGDTTPATYTNINGASGTSTNPASGSSNTNDTYTLTQSDMIANATNWFIYISKATNSTFGTEQTSASDPVTFDMPRDITDLSVSSTTPTTATLAWTGTTGSSSYKIYYSSDNGSTYSLAATTNTPGYTVSALSAATLYYFKIVPYTGTNGNGYYGNDSNITSDTTKSIYTFSFGNNLYVGTNGYIGLDGGSTVDYINSTGTGRFIGILPGDLQQSTATSIWYWSDSTDYIIRWEGYHYGQSGNTRVYQIRFTSGQSYASVYALYVTNSSEGTQAFVQDGVTKTSYPSALTTGSQYRVYFDGSTAPVAITSELEKGTAQMTQVGGLTSGSLDQGYTTLTTATNQQNTPGSLSITPQHFGNGYIYVFYTTGANTDSIVATASRYDYINGNGAQSKSNTVAVAANSRGYLVLDVSLYGSYNNAVPWSISATPRNGSNLGTAVSSSVSASTNNYPVATVGTVSAGNQTLSATVSLSGAANYYTLTVTPSGGSTTTYNQQTGNISLSGLTNGTSYTLNVTPKYYYYLDSVTDSNSYTYSGTTVTRSGTPVAPSYTITYFGNTNTGGSTSATSGPLPLTIASNGFTKTGYTFSGWNTASGGGGTAYSAGATYNTAANLNLYAQWTIVPVIPTISMSANSGITSSAGTINWTSTNQASWSSDGTFSGSGTTETSLSKTGLSASQTYTGTVTVTSSTGNTASANYSLTTSAAYTGPTAPTGLSVTGGTVTGNLSTTLIRNSSTNKTQNWTTSTSQAATISWTKGTGNGTIKSDVKWQQNNSTTPPASDTGTWTGVTGSSQLDSGNAGGTVNYYWVRTVDGDGLKSAWTYAGSYTAESPSMSGFTIRIYRGSATPGGATGYSSPTTAPSSTSTGGSYTWTGLTNRDASPDFGHYAWANGTLNGTVKTATSATV